MIRICDAGKLLICTLNLTYAVPLQARFARSLSESVKTVVNQNGYDGMTFFHEWSGRQTQHRSTTRRHR